MYLSYMWAKLPTVDVPVFISIKPLHIHTHTLTVVLYEYHIRIAAKAAQHWKCTYECTARVQTYTTIQYVYNCTQSYYRWTRVQICRQLHT